MEMVGIIVMGLDDTLIILVIEIVAVILIDRFFFVQNAINSIKNERLEKGVSNLHWV